MTALETTGPPPIFRRDGAVGLIDQTGLPHEGVWLELTDYLSVVAATITVWWVARARNNTRLAGTAEALDD